jgi:anthranilate synthase/aminodeoxychorismate synthase-like glutamine amidotransferase
LFIDHYDSFSRNLVDWLSFDNMLEVQTIYSDSVNESLPEIPIIFGPGPGAPSDYPKSMALIQDRLGRVPMLGICLGHQMFGVTAGGELQRAARPFHGSARLLRRNAPLNEDYARRIPEKLSAATYNSLIVTPPSDSQWQPLMRNEYGEMEALSYSPDGAPDWRGVLSVQFHPESFLTEDAEWLRKWWCERVAAFYNWQIEPLPIPS